VRETMFASNQEYRLANKLAPTGPALIHQILDHPLLIQQLLLAGIDA